MNWDSIPKCKEALSKGAASLKCLEAVFANILTAITLLAGMALFVMLCVGGFRYLTSGGDPKTAEGAKNTMTYALVGMVLIGVAFLIFRLIENFTGVSILTFTIPD